MRASRNAEAMAEWEGERGEERTDEAMQSRRKGGRGGRAYQLQLFS